MITTCYYNEQKNFLEIYECINSNLPSEYFRFIERIHLPYDKYISYKEMIYSEDTILIQMIFEILKNNNEREKNI
jgi:hypothetical protein